MVKLMVNAQRAERVAEPSRRWSHWLGIERVARVLR
jgi:hypothetical protein